MTRGMIRDGAFESRAHVFDLQHVDQELRELENPRPNRGGLLGECGFAGQQIAVEDFEHAGARTGRHHDWNSWLHRFKESTRESNRLGAESLIECDLAAA